MSDETDMRDAYRASAADCLEACEPAPSLSR